jgi:tetratricopeptide (TPR) repeat protein
LLNLSAPTGRMETTTRERLSPFPRLTLAKGASISYNERGVLPQEVVVNMPRPKEADPSAPTMTHPTEPEPTAGVTPGPVTLPPPFSYAPIAVPPWPVGYVFLDDFEVEAVLGQGGMGVVYRVRQCSTSQPLAVKRARFSDADGRRRFLAELQLWLDLPAHPHLAPCRFYRTVAEEVVIFTDLAEGGSLAGWIEQRRLPGVHDILNVAVQVAWGLHALHEAGMVHQDVKPANVLLSADGTARVTDFGLARARARLLPPPLDEVEGSILVSSAALTPAYCSPEQQLRRPVSRRTDIWSWGVLVLEMFVGRVPCCEQGGPSAAHVLARHRQGGLPLEPIEPMPAAVAEVLDLCFQVEPSRRWATLADAADLLLDIYQQYTGAAYPRPAPALRDRGDAELVAARPAGWSGRWEPPRKWLAIAYEAAGRDPTEVEADLPPPASTRKAQAVADLAVYVEARGLLERLIAEGRTDLERRRVGLLVQQALVHVSVSDWTQALDLFDRAIASWQRLVYQERKHELTPALVRTLLYRAEAMRSMGDHTGAIALCDRVVQLWQKLDNRRARRDLRDDLAAAYLEKGLSLRSVGKVRQGVQWFGRAIEIWQELAEEQEREGPANDLARACLCKASSLSGLGLGDEALELCDRAIAIRRRLVQREGRREMRGDLARAYMHKANVLRSRDDSGASPLYDQACSLLEHCVHEEGRDDLAHELAQAYLARAAVERHQGEPLEAARACARAAGIWEGLVEREGRHELTHDLARAYLHQAHALRLAGEHGPAVELCDRAIGLWDRLVHSQGRIHMTNDLARSYSAKAAALRGLGKFDQALQLIDQAIELRRQLLTQTGRDDLPGDLARDRSHRGEILLALGRQDEGRAELAEAAAVLAGLVAQAPRSDLRGALNRARRLLQEPI